MIAEACGADVVGCEASCIVEYAALTAADMSDSVKGGSAADGSLEFGVPCTGSLAVSVKLN